MSPILGIWASAQQPALNATSFESIATVTVGAGGSSTISFSSIPSTYKHLQIRWFARSSAAGVDGNWITFNSDTAANYKSHYLLGNGSSAAAGALSTNNYAFAYYSTSSSETTSVFGSGIVDLLDYANTNKYKVLRNLGGYDNNGSGTIIMNSSLWMNTNAITNIVMQPANGGNYIQYSSFALYGVKG